LARRIVGAEVQIITYEEFLPALLGASAPSADGYNYSSGLTPAITQAFAHATYRFGHSTLSPQLQLINDDGTSSGSLDLRNVFFNPSVLSGDPNHVELLLKGAVTQRAQKIDNLLVDDVRNFLFGQPGSGGLDLASLNVQRGRDHGLPDYNLLRIAYSLPKQISFSQITSDANLQQDLMDLYDNDIDNIDAWVGALAEDHVAGSSAGELMHAIIGNQFERLRDGDRLFYLSDDLGLYTSGILDSDIASIIDLDTVRLSDVILANTPITNIPQNVFVVPEPASGVLLPMLLLLSCRRRRSR